MFAIFVCVEVVGAQLCPETEEGEGTGTREMQKMSPWGYLVYKNTPNINMINYIGIVRLSALFRSI